MSEVRRTVERLMKMKRRVRKGFNTAAQHPRSLALFVFIKTQFYSIGGWFVWRTEQTEPIQLIAGGSGIVPLMAMIRLRASVSSTAPFRLLYSVREPGAVLYRDELQALSGHDHSVSLTDAYTRAVPKDWRLRPGRIGATLIANTTWPSNLVPTCYVLRPHIVR